MTVRYAHKHLSINTIIVKKPRDVQNCIRVIKDSILENEFAFELELETSFESQQQAKQIF